MLDEAASGVPGTAGTLRVWRWASAGAMLAALPALLLILLALLREGLLVNAALHGLVIAAVLAELLILWRWSHRAPLGDRLMALAFSADALGLAVANLLLDRPLLFTGFPALMLLFLGAGLLLVLPPRTAAVGLSGLYLLNVVGDWWPHQIAGPLELLVQESVLAGILALAIALALYREWLDTARSERQTFERLAHTDQLTELPNRRAVLAAWRTLNARQATALLILDLDDFKRINDRYGHPEGDRVLWQVGQVLLQALDGRGTLGRWGGEEFLAVLPLADPAQACEVAEALRESVRAAGAEPEPLSISVGLTLSPRGEPFGPALRRADAALYRAKRDGKNAVRLEEAELKEC